MGQDDPRVRKSLHLLQHCKYTQDASANQVELRSGAGIAVGGPAFVMYISPTEEELFKRYNPDLQKRALESRYERQKEYDDFVTELKKSAKSDKNSELG